MESPPSGPSSDRRPVGTSSAGTGTPAAPGGPLAFTFGSWYTWTATGLALPILGILLVASSDLLAGGAYESFPAFAATHVATLGWITMTIMGAAAQMAPALLGTRIRGERTVPWQYALYALGVLAVVAGFLSGDFDLVAAGGVGVNVASWWFIALTLLTVASAGTKRAVLSPHIPAALACFVLVSIWGTLLAANLRWGLWPALLVSRRGLVVHLTLGLGGWFGLMVVGTFYRLVPLILGARVASVPRGWAILVAALLAVAGVPAGVAWGAGWMLRAAAVLAAAALVLFGWEVCHVLAHRRNRAPDLNVAHWYAVVTYSVVLACAGAGWGLGWLRSDPPERLGECVVVVFLLGWVTQAVIGQLYKVTPFLMWYYRATIPDVLAIPRQPAPYNPRPGRAAFLVSNAGVAGLAVGVWIGAASVTRIGAVFVAVAGFMLAYMLAYRWIPPAISKALVFEWRWRIS